MLYRRGGEDGTTVAGETKEREEVREVSYVCLPLHPLRLCSLTRPKPARCCCPVLGEQTVTSLR